MPRYAKPITEEELEQFLLAKTKEVIESYGEKYNKEEILSSPLMRLIPESDLTVEFDCENEVYFRFHQMNGFTIALWQVGGDWEIPMYFAMYIDTEGNLRVYIPTYGNVFNIYTMTAFGSERAALGQPMPESMPEGLREGYGDDEDDSEDDEDDDWDEYGEYGSNRNNWNYDDEDETEYEKYVSKVENSENISYILADIAANICVEGNDVIPLPNNITFPYYKGITPDMVGKKREPVQE